MKPVTLILCAAVLATGCFVQSTGRSSSASTARSRDCPPAYHWEGGACVHNGKAKGHYKH
ncbi:MAG TPA: hypothetical protein VFT22_39390 [Kofleriaceae bacterium]|nr:hypothetical protein [Kofleriaceae bacterium]